MFTGLIEEMGVVESISSTSSGIKIKIKCDKVVKEGKVGDSIATNGVCLTATSITRNSFTADIMNESVKRSNLSLLKVGSLVNLEKSLTLQTPLGGHIVTGDVDCVGEIVSIKSDGFAKIYEFSLPYKYMRYIVEKGRVSIDGASLTIADVYSTTFTLSIIPHTQEMITLGKKGVGDIVNIECDLFGKFVERILMFKEEEKKSTLSMSTLFENGFI